MKVNRDDRLPRRASRADAAFERGAERLLEVVTAACDTGADFVGRVESALRAGLALLAEDPALARLLTIGIYSGGEEAAVRKRYWLERHGALLRRAAADTLDMPAHPEFVEPAIAAGVWGQICRGVLDGQVEQIERLLPDLLEFVLVYYLDAEEAGRIAGPAREASSQARR